jgi:hypothetical protein
MALAGLPLDTRTHGPEQAEELDRLRDRTTDDVWRQVPGLRRLRRCFAIETTADKPHRVAGEVALDREAGYVDLCVATCPPLEVCQSRNLQRQRILTPAVVERTWHTFQRNLNSGVYPSIFGEDRFICRPHDQPFDVLEWIAAVTRGRQGG